MPSSASRSQIVTRALSIAGRGAELRASASDWLNEMLRDWSLDFRYPSLRKVGSPLTLPIGSNTVALPADFGAGMEKQGMLFGQENTRLNEKTPEEFSYLGGFPPSGTSNGRPMYYMVDRNAWVFRFNSAADQAYPFIPIYFQVSTDIDTSAAGDNTKVWVENDRLVTQGLVEMIYQFTGDEREEAQHQKVYNPQQGLLAKWQRQVASMGGQNRIMPSPERFKIIRY